MSPRLRSTSAILVAFVVPLCTYAASIRGDLSLWDTADLQTVPYILGIPYPTGFPGFVLLGWLWSHAEPVGSVAVRMNLLTAFASAVTVAALCSALIALDIGIGVALAASAVFAFASVPWNHATYVDVHPVSFAAVAVAIVFLLRWQRAGDRRSVAAALAAMTAALAIDNTTVLALPAFVLLVLIRRPSFADIARAGALALCPLAAVYAYLPLRSANVTAARLDPALALGIAPGRPFWDDGHPADWTGFLGVVAGTRFGPHDAALHMFAPASFRAVAQQFAPAAMRDLGIVMLVLAVFGALLWWWRAPFVLGAFLLLGIVPLLFIFAYPAESDPTRYYLGAYAAIVAASAYGAQALSALPRAPRVAAALAGVALVALTIGVDLQNNRWLFAQPSDPGASAWLGRVRVLTSSDAIVVAPWMYATPLGYGAYVERSLGARVIVTAEAREFQSKYREWLARRPLVVVSDDPMQFGGFVVRELDRGLPHLYALR